MLIGFHIINDNAIYHGLALNRTNLSPIKFSLSTELFSLILGYQKRVD